MAKNSRLSNDQKQRLAEMTGLDSLREFIPDSDYTDSLIEHAASWIPKDQRDDDSYVITPEREAMLERSRAVLTYLRDNGHNYSVEADKNNGQLKAKLEGSNIEIRVLDTDENAQYIGRVYNNGVSYNFTKGASESKKDGVSDPITNITPDMAVDLVKYGLGETVNRRENLTADRQHAVIDRKVGEVVRNKYGTDLQNYQPKSNDGFSAVYEERTPRVVNNKNVSETIYIRCLDEKKNNTESFDDVPEIINGQKVVRAGSGLEKAENYIKNSMQAAEDNFNNKLHLDAVDKAAELYAAGEFEGDVGYSDDPMLSDVQKAYFDQRKTIYTDNEAYPDTLAMDNAERLQDEAVKNQVSETFGNQSLRSINALHVAKYMDDSKGMLSNEENLINALRKVKRSSNPDYDIIGDEFESANLKNKMVDFNPNPHFANGKSYPMNIDPEGEDADNLSPFWKEMGKSVREGLTGMGVVPSSIQVDENGVIHYEGGRTSGAIVTAKSKPEWKKITGDIGQVFEPDDRDYIEKTDENGNITREENLAKGLIETKFNSGNNYYLVPGYTAYIVPPSEELGTIGQNYIERTRARGYLHEMSSKIKSTLRADLVSNPKDGHYDNTTGLNDVYKSMYGDKKSLDFIDKMRETGVPDRVIKALNETELLRFKYDKHYSDETGILSQMNAKNIENKEHRGYDTYLDNVQANINIPDHSLSKNIFDPYATGTGTNQGGVRFGTSDMTVNPDGTITPGKSEFCPLLELDEYEYMRNGNNTNDRGVMTIVNALNQSSTAYGRDVNLSGEKIDPIGVGMAHMSLGGYTQDDAFVVSKEFADSNLIRGEDGNLRSLKIGDKICDHSGNKGVISFVADRNADMSYYEPEPIAEGMSVEECKYIEKKNNEKEQQKKVIELFKDNPTLDIVGAPYTAPSRFNGGTAREMIDSQEKAKNAGMSTDLVVNGEVHEGSIGYAKIIITDMPVDVKTHIYGSNSRVKEESLEEDGEYSLNEDDHDIGETSGGRKASGQMVWGLSEMNADAIIKEIYGNNDNPMVKAREMLIATGLDISETGKIHNGYEPHQIGIDENNKAVYEERKETSIREAYAACHGEKPGEVNNNKLKEYFAEAMGEDGGFMKVPFPVKMATGEMTPEVLDENGNGTGEYRLPVLSGKFRSGRETVDNSMIMHEYTSRYKEIFDASIDYLKNEEKINNAGPDGNYHYEKKGKNGGEGIIPKSTLTENMAEAQGKAQKSYSFIADDIIERQFTGKHNVWKDDVMRKELKDTATAVITPDPTLDLNEIRMGTKMAIGLGIIDDKTNVEEFNRNGKLDDKLCMIWRDPLLSGGGERAFTVSIVEDRPGRPGYNPNNPNNGIVGFQMNPSSATSFEGDFDGDSMGAYKPKSKAAIKDAKEKLSAQAQLLNREMGNPGEHKAYFQDELDVAAGVYRDAEKGGNIKTRMEEAEKLMNLSDLIGDTRVNSNSGNGRAFNAFNEAMHDAHRASFGQDVISYKDSQSHMESLFPMTEEGAKGSIDKLKKGYAPYFGCKFEVDENNKIISFEDVPPYATPEARQASMAAGHAKACLTGVAGKFSQHAEMMALNFSPKSTSRKAYPEERKMLNAAYDCIEHGYKVEPCKRTIEVDEIVNNKATGNKIKKEIDTFVPVVMRDENGKALRDKNGKLKLEPMEYMSKDENGKTVISPEAADIINAVRAKSDEINPKPAFSASVAATALTHPVTQSVMQLKHDTGPEILHKIEMIQDVAPALWAGKKIEKCVDESTGEPSWRVVREKNSEGKMSEVPVSPDEWKKMFKDFYEDKHGLNVGTPNPKHVEMMADIMTVDARDEKGNPCKRIEGFDTKTKKILKTETPLTRLAYEGNFDTLKEFADKNADLFEGTTSSYIAPRSINANKAEAAKRDIDPDYIPKIKGFAAKDTRCVDNEITTISIDAIHEAMKSGKDVHIKQIMSDEDEHESDKTETLKLDPNNKAYIEPEDRKYFEDTSKNVENNGDIKWMTSDEDKNNKTETLKLDPNNKAYIEPEDRKYFEKDPCDKTNVNSGDIRYLAEGKSKNIEKNVEKPAENVEKSSNQRASDNKHYADMEVNDKVQTAQSYVQKVYAQRRGEQGIEFTAAEKEFKEMFMNQKKLYASLGTTENKDKYEAEHPNAFNEYMTGNGFIREENRKLKTPELDNLSEEQYNKVAKSVTAAYMDMSRNGNKPIFTNNLEQAFNERLTSQNSLLQSVPANERSKYISDHRDEFRERLACGRMRKEMTHTTNSAKFDTAVTELMSEEDAAKKLSKQNDNTKNFV